MMEFRKPAGKFFGIMALGLGLALGCGDDDKKDEKKAKTVAEKEEEKKEEEKKEAATLGLVEQMLADACAKKETENGVQYLGCSRSAPSSFWQRDESPWNDNAQEFSIIHGTVDDASATDWYITDKDGNVLPEKVITLKQGLPVILKVVQRDDAGARKHYLTAAPFFDSAVFRKVQSNDGEYKSSTFNAVENLTTAGSIDMYFIPMITGEFDGYCQIGVTNGSNFVGLKAGTVQPDFETGHAGATGAPKSEMYVKFIVEGEHNVSLEAHDSTRNTAYNGHAWGNDKDQVGQDGNYGACLWGDTDRCAAVGGTLETVVTKYVRAVNNNDGTMKFEEVDLNADGVTYENPRDLGGDSKLTLTLDKAHKLRFISEDTNAKHYLTAPELYKTSVFRKAMDTVAELKADYFKAVELLKAPADGSKHTELFFVPRQAGDFEATCTEDDHESQGMKFTITVE